MKVKVIDENTFRIIASEAEIQALGAKPTEVHIDNTKSFVCSNEPSAAAYKIPGAEGVNKIFNTDLDITLSPCTTDEFLIVFITLANGTFVVLPCYNNTALLEYIADTSNIFQTDCSCGKDEVDATKIVLYYAFKLSLAIADYQKAIKMWDRLFINNNITIKSCGCNG